ncbi:MAG: spore germination protein [Paenibacillaceae bacterium]|jgi:spore germination protein (amino acid permease)|nr:spore germination protein [Paenibacillaceae bacterium]
MDKGKLTQKQLFFMSSFYIFGTMLITLPRTLTEVAQHAGWLCIMIAMTLFAGYSWLLAQIITGMKQTDFIPFVHSFLGKWLGPPVTLVLILIPALFYSSYVMRLVVELFETLVIPETPVEILLILTITLRFWAVRGGIRTVGMLSELLLPTMLIVMITMLALSGAKVQMTSLQPFFDTDANGIFKGSMAVLSNYMEVGVLLFAATRIKESQKTLKSLLAVNVTVGFIFLCTYWLCLGNFGTAYTKRLAFPTVEMIRNISLANFFEHVEVIFLAMWVLMNLVKGSMTYYACCVGFQSWFGLKSYKLIMMPVLLIIYYLSMIPQNLLQAVFRFEQFKAVVYPYYGLAFIVVLYGLVRLRNRSKGAAG